MKQVISAAYTDEVTPRELENRQVAYRAALEGIVLLKNSGNALPIAPGRLALYGAGAKNTVKGGTGSGEVNERYSVSILQGLEEAGFTVTTEKWLSDFDALCADSYSRWKKSGAPGTDIINSMSDPFQAPVGRVISDEDISASDTDTAIYVVARQAGEGSDKKLEKGEFSLASEEIKSIEKMAACYKRSVLVINSGSYMDIGDLDDKVSAVIYYCQQGMEGGRAFADIISGKVSPSGKLTDSWARKYSDIPFGMEYSYLDGDPRKNFYREGIFVGYRYFDASGVKPRYCFGHGLSYTEFALTCVSASLDGESVELSINVENIGSASGREVVQVYASLPKGQLVKERRRLVAFAKTDELAPGQSRRLTVSFGIDYLSSYCENNSSKMLEKGRYVLSVGNSADSAVPCAAISLDETVIYEKLRSVCPVREEFEELRPHFCPDDAEADLDFDLSLKAADIKTKTAFYTAPFPCRDSNVEKVISSLTQKEMIDLCVGTGIAGMLDTSLIFAPGTVGRTTGTLAGKGIPNVNLADGPAGLRLLKVCGLNARGKLRFYGENYMTSAIANAPDAAKRIMSTKKGDTLLYQFTTAFPVGTALAQSWNTALCQEVGRAVSREMDDYAVTFWLAPAMNIHRNPLCGRSFEYFSEDPVLTGKIGAAICRGVQSLEGCYATVKHFACNNAEDERNRSDSIVHEKALREIYLRGFEICVKEGRPRSVMTGYNKLNGVYTPNSHDLCTKILRNEWGFDGIVMTDWFSTLPGLADAGTAIGAGNDMLMPGTVLDKLSIMRGLDTFRLSYSDLRRSAGYIARLILSSRTAKKNGF